MENEISILRRNLSLNPEDRLVYRQLAAAYRRLGKELEAKKVELQEKLKFEDIIITKHIGELLSFLSYPEKIHLCCDLIERGLPLLTGQQQEDVAIVIAVIRKAKNRDRMWNLSAQLRDQHFDTNTVLMGHISDAIIRVIGGISATSAVLFNEATARFAASIRVILSHKQDSAAEFEWFREKLINYLLGHGRKE